MQVLAASSPTQIGRDSVRDMNTLLDESGVVVPYADAGMAEVRKICVMNYGKINSIWADLKAVAQGTPPKTGDYHGRW